MVPLYATVLATPPGPLALIVDADRLVAAGYVDAPEQLHTRLDEPRRTRPLRLMDDLSLISRQIDDYHRGDLDALERVPVEQVGTEHQRAIWSALRAIPAGETRTYTELAATIGRPRAVRAAGTACGRNLVAPVIPCHRALRADGSLGGYYYGLPIKRWLLQHEASQRRPEPAQSAASPTVSARSTT